MTDAVCVVIVSHNSSHVIAECLSGLRFLAEPSWAGSLVVLVDNGSTDDTLRTVEGFRRDHPDVPVEVVRSVNRGWGAGNNQGVKVAQRRPILLLNPDAGINADSLRHLLRALADAPVSVAAVVPAMEAVGGPPSAQPLPTRWGLWWWDLGGRARSSRRFLSRSATTGDLADLADAYPSGALALLRCEAVEAVGAFDERIFLYFDDADFGWRLRDHGYSIRYVPGAVGWHRLGAGSVVAGDTVSAGRRMMLFHAAEITFAELHFGSAWTLAFAVWRAGPYFPMVNAIRRRRGLPLAPTAQSRRPALDYLRRRLSGASGALKSRPSPARRS